MPNEISAPITITRTLIDAPVAFRRVMVDAPLMAARDAYQLAVASGFEGTRSEWLASLNGSSVELTNDGITIKWRVVGADEWIDLIAVDLLVGEQGNDGQRGNDGRSPEVAVDNGWVVWRLVGDVDWIQLIEVASLVGEAGPNTVSTSTSTDIVGLVKGDGLNVSAAIPGVDYTPALPDTYIPTDIGGNYYLASEGSYVSSNENYEQWPGAFIIPDPGSLPVGTEIFIKDEGAFGPNIVGNVVIVDTFDAVLQVLTPNTVYRLTIIEYSPGTFGWQIVAAATPDGYVDTSGTEPLTNREMIEAGRLRTILVGKSAPAGQTITGNLTLVGNFVAENLTLSGTDSRAPNQVVVYPDSLMTRQETARNYIRRFFNARDLPGTSGYVKGGVTASFAGGSVFFITSSTPALNLRHNRAVGLLYNNYFENSGSNGSNFQHPDPATYSLPMSVYSAGSFTQTAVQGSILSGATTETAEVVIATMNNSVGLFVTGGYPKLATWQAGGTEITITGRRPASSTTDSAVTSDMFGLAVGMAVVGPFAPHDTVITTINGTVVTVSNPMLVSSDSCGGDIAFSPYPNGTYVASAVTASATTSTVTMSAPALVTLGGVRSCEMTSGASTVTPDSISGLYVGQSVTGTGIQSSTTVTGINSDAGTITLSKTVTQNGPQNLTFSHTFRLLVFHDAVYRFLAGGIYANQSYESTTHYPWCEYALAYNGVHGNSFLTGVTGFGVTALNSAGLTGGTTGSCTSTGTAVTTCVAAGDIILSEGFTGVVAGWNALAPALGVDHYVATSMSAQYIVLNSSAGVIPNGVILNGTTTNASAVVAVNDTSGISIGMRVVGAGIPTTTVVLSISPNVSVTLDKAATASATTKVGFSSSLQTVTFNTKTFTRASGDTLPANVTGMIRGFGGDMVNANGSCLVRTRISHPYLPANTELVNTTGNLTALTSAFTGTIASSIATYLPNSMLDFVKRMGTTTENSPTVTVAVGTNLYVGLRVNGVGIPINTFVTVVNGTTITLSQNATATSGVNAAELYFGGRVVHGPGIQPGTVILGTSSQDPVSKATCTTTSGSTVVTVLDGSGVAGLEPGMRVEGSSVPAGGAWIVAMGPAANQITLSAAWGASGNRALQFGGTFRVELSHPLSFPSGMRTGQDYSIRGIHQGCMGFGVYNGKSLSIVSVQGTNNMLRLRGLAIAKRRHPSTGLDCVCIEEDSDGVLRTSPYVINPLALHYFSQDGKYGYAYNSSGVLQHLVMDHRISNYNSILRLWWAVSPRAYNNYWPILPSLPQLEYTSPEQFNAPGRGWYMLMVFNGSQMFARSGDINHQYHILPPGIGYYPLESFA